MRRLLCALILLPVLSACDHALVIPDRFPEPMVATLPVDMALLYTPEFTGYRYREETDNGAEWVIDLGKANVALFDTISKRLFRSAVRIDAMPSPGASLPYSAILEPSVEAFEFSLPEQSATDQYSVWIRYNLKVFGPDGALITTWNVSAYGESAATMLQPARSMEQATITALRDAGATISVDFATEAKIRETLLKEKADVPE